jgi:hypothetical protein
VGAGAKVLGGFTVGAGARIGSNSVVVKAVPPGATAVGIPARIVEPQPAQNAETPARKRFAAYGVAAGTDDPLTKAVQQLIEHIAEQDQRIEQLCAELSAAACRRPRPANPSTPTGSPSWWIDARGERDHAASRWRNRPVAQDPANARHCAAVRGFIVKPAMQHRLVCVAVDQQPGIEAHHQVIYRSRIDIVRGFRRGLRLQTLLPQAVRHCETLVDRKAQELLLPVG